MRFGHGFRSYASFGQLVQPVWNPYCLLSDNDEVVICAAVSADAACFE